MQKPNARTVAVTVHFTRQEARLLRRLSWHQHFWGSSTVLLEEYVGWLVRGALADMMTDPDFLKSVDVDPARFPGIRPQD